MTDVAERLAGRTPETSEPSVDRRRRAGWLVVAELAALLLVGIAAVWSMAPSAPAGPDAPTDRFSAARAMTHIAATADAPRPVGSAKHAEARAYLLGQLASLGWRTEVQESVGMLDFGRAGTQNMGAVANVIATRPGSAPTGTVILTGHYDTVLGAPGAADDGIAIGVLLETARALGTAGAGRNTVMVLLTDAEEVGLLGAEAFVRERASELGTTVVLNHEASGAGGGPLTFRMSSPNGALLDVLAGAPGASADSGSEATFATLSHDTDFTPFERGGMYGFDTAILADGAYYHSPNDDPAHLSGASLQQMGDTTLAMTRELAGMDLGVIADGGEEIVLALPWGLLRYPQGLEVPLAIGVLVLVAVLVWGLRRRGALTLPRAALSVAAAVVLLVAAGAAAYAVWRVALLVDPAQASAVLGQPYRPLFYRLAMLLAGLWVVVSVYALLRRRLGAVGLAVGMLVLLALAGVLLAVTVPGLSGTVVQPALVVVIGAVVAALLPERRTAARTGVYLVALAAAAILLGPAIWVGFDLGLGTGPVSAALLGLFATLALPLVPAAGPRPAGTAADRKAPGAGFGVAVARHCRPHRGRPGGQPRGRDGCPAGADRVLGRHRYPGCVLGLGCRAGERLEPVLAEPAGRTARRRLPVAGGKRAPARSGAGRRPGGTRGRRARGRHPWRHPRADAPDLLPPGRPDARSVGRRRHRHGGQRDRRRAGRPDRSVQGQVGLRVPLLRGAGGRCRGTAAARPAWRRRHGPGRRLD